MLKYLYPFLATTTLLVLPTIASAQTYQPSNRAPVADNTLGTQVSGNGNNFNITGGVNKGQTLFHSFTDFSVPTNGAANFNNPVGNRDIITRVTGNLFSDINGTVNTNGANFFLINPNGIVFGTNARLNVGKAFVGSTANSIDLVDGSGRAITFGTNASGDAPLLSIAPNVLFDVSRLNLSGGNSAISNFGTLQTNNNSQYIGLIGGNVTLNGGKINAPGGRVELGGLLTTGSVVLGVDANNLRAQFPANVARGDVSLTNQARVSVADAGGGDIAISARNLEILSGSVIRGGLEAGLGTPEAVAGDIKVDATGAISIVGSDSGIGNIVRLNSTGNGGNINVNAASLSLSNEAQLGSGIYGTGNAGNVTVKVAGAVSVVDKAGIFSTVTAGGVGKGGTIDINAGSFSIKDGAQIVTSTREASANQAAGQGDAGNVNIKVNGAVDIAGTNGTLSSGIRSLVETGTKGNAGNITVDAGSFSLRDGAQLKASTFGTGNAGNVTVTAKDAIFLNGDIFSQIGTTGIGKGGTIDINSGSLSLTNGGVIGTSVLTLGQGNAGNINIKTTGDITIAGNNTVSGISSSSSGQGNAGKIIIDSQGKISLANSGAIFAAVLDEGTGNSQDISITAKNLSLSNNSFISSNNFGVKGNAGNINVKVSGAIDIAGIKRTSFSGIFSDVYGTGNGGNISLDTTSLALLDDGRLSTATYGIGNAGNVTVTARDAASLAGNSFILSTVEAGGVGKGGTIDINAGSLSLKDSAQLLTITRGASYSQPAGQGDAGNVKVKVSGNVDIAGINGAFPSGIRSLVETGTKGNGGNITIDAGSFSLSNGAELKASTYGTGNAGNVTVKVTDAVSLDKAAIFSTVEAGAVGKGGNIDINAGSLSLINVAQLLTAASEASATRPAGQGDAGNVNVKVAKAVYISGTNDAVSSGIISEVGLGANGKGGNITVDADSLLLRDRAQLRALTAGTGNAGNVTVKVTDTASLDRASIFSTVEAGAVGKGGNIDINAGTLSLIGSQLITVTRKASATQPAGQGDAGNVKVKVTGAVEIVSTKDGFQSAIASIADTGTKGNGGNITVDAGSFLLQDNAQLAASNLGQGDAGNIVLNSNKIVLNDGGISSTSASYTGGDIAIKTTEYLLLRNSSFITTTSDSTNLNGNGGNITIGSPLIIALPQGNSIAADANGGNGGNVNITSQGLFGIQYRPKGQATPSSNDITASSTFGQDGAVNISTPGTDPGRDSTELPNVTTDASNQISQVCGASTRQNKLTVTGRGGLPPNANDPLTSDVVWQDARAASSQPAASSTTINPVKLAPPAVGWVFDGKGKVTLIAAGSQGQPTTGTSVVCPNNNK
jgi:filamentous hemagglutinin family protein